MSRKLIYFLAACLSFATAPAYGKEPTLKIALPSKGDDSKYYYVQPVNVSLSGTGASDGLVKLEISVASNPQEHQLVLSADFSETARVSLIKTRLRLAGKGMANVKAAGLTLSGKKIFAEEKIRHKKGVDFSAAESLTRRLPGNVKGLNGPIGTARTLMKNNGGYSRQMMNIIYHPMLPSIDEQEPQRLQSLELVYRGVLLGRFTFGDAISNDPYIEIEFSDQQEDVGPARIQWQDSRGNSYQPEKITVK